MKGSALNTQILRRIIKGDPLVLSISILVSLCYIPSHLERQIGKRNNAAATENKTFFIVSDFRPCAIIAGGNFQEERWPSVFCGKG
jgi:hypothetical protein